ncbi:EamA family transporter RarD [uncultured Desulfuromusa sp.]|uniref:EamA family transporter RarD n=1 Tax=uncultured Desulfuromusa sp. TaxID=219183 RepID=UPI002AA76603|nr:EamA family transporter RarD [uncultured Desulfuromusa sp.]
MSSRFSGPLFGLAAFVAWGFLPVYWKQLAAVPPFEILCHRIIWSCVFLCLIISWQHRWEEVRQIVAAPADMGRLSVSSLLIGGNWLIYIVAVNTGHVVETSLGYYITPMVNILLGVLLLKERFSRLQTVAVLCAFAGVVYSLLGYGTLPKYALSLAFLFAFYGYLRKKTVVAPIPGLLVETFVLVVPALIYLLYRQIYHGSPFLVLSWDGILLIGAGVTTSLPLLWFAAAARQLQLSTIGILQYLAPSIAFLLGVFLYREPFDQHSQITFILIWLGVAVYCADALRFNRKVSA